MQPDPFEDIPAPRLRLLRPGAALALAKPRSMPLQPPAAPAGRSRATDAGPRDASGAAAGGPAPSARAAAASVLRLSRPEATSPGDPGPGNDAPEVPPRWDGGGTSAFAGDGGFADAVGPTDGAGTGPASPDAFAPMDDAANWGANRMDDAAQSSVAADPAPEIPAPALSPAGDVVAPAQRIVRKIRASHPERRARDASVPVKPSTSAGLTYGIRPRGGRAFPAVAAPGAGADAAAAGHADAEPPAGPGVASGSPAKAQPQPARAASAPSRRAASDLRRGIIAGLIAAVAIVVLALLLRPTLGDSAPAPDAAAVPVAVAPAPVPDPERAVATAATPTSGIAVRLRLGPEPSDAYRDALRDAVERAGYASVEVRAMPYPVDRSRIQFYAPADRPAAEALARALAPVTGGLPEMRDLGPIARPDEAGSVDAWLVAEPADG